MELTLETLEMAVLRLPLDQRARLLDRLVASIDGAPDDMAEMDAAWDSVADAREAELASGAVQEVPLAGALQRVRASL